MRIFITGCESFIGKVLRQMCADAGHEVRGIDRTKCTWSGPCWRTDIRYFSNMSAALPDDSVVIHLAAVSTDKLCRENPLEALDVNVSGTLNVAKAAMQRKCRQFIFASTEWVYGEGEEATSCGELCWTPAEGVYAQSKLIGEQLLALSGLPNVTILRFGITYGPRPSNWCAVEALADKVLRGEDITVGSLRTARRFIHVRDLCAGILASIGRTGVETFNLAGNELVTLEKILWTACCAADKGTWEAIVTDPDNPSIRNPDSSKAQVALGWKPQIAFADGMKEVVEYLKARAE